jgi:L-ribulose-5-phosphate 3-epimerase
MCYAMRTISFITANYVARAKNYSGEENWGVHDRATVAAASPEHFKAVAADVANAGFQHIDIWTGHCSWQHHSPEYLEQVKGICSQYDLNITSYAGGFLSDDRASIERALKFMKQLGAPLFAGGSWGKLPEAEVPPIVNDICAQLGVKWARENHPEKSAEEMLAGIGGGRYEHCGICLDTGWAGTQGFDALEAAKKLRDKLLIVHLKDVKQAGGHETCALGEGVVAVEKVVRYLVESDWHGDIGIEHEPYDRDPMPEVQRSLQRVQEWLKG